MVAGVVELPRTTNPKAVGHSWPRLTGGANGPDGEVKLDSGNMGTSRLADLELKMNEIERISRPRRYDQA